MSSLSGYDSEAVGFDSAVQARRPEACAATQTSELAARGAGSQTARPIDVGCAVSPEDVDAGDDVSSEYPPPGLDEFLRKVVPSMLEQLAQSDAEPLHDSSDSDEEEFVSAKLLQEIRLSSDALGAGDHHTSVLGLAWSSAGNSLAVSVGQAQHETWCENPGLIQVYILKGDQFVHEMDVTERNCVTVLKYHPAVAALLAYGTTSGEVVLCDLRSGSLAEGTQLASPPGCHGSRRVAALQWADARLADVFLLMQINNKGKRRGASDQVLISGGSDGTLNVWQVNANTKVFENVLCYTINGSKKLPAPDLTCFDFAKTVPLGAADEKSDDQVFVVGTKCGKLYLCKVEGCDADMDPVLEALEGHATCVLDVAFSSQKPGVFVSVSTDGELRLYDVKQSGPLKVICLDVPVSCVGWLRHPCAVVGLARAEGEVLKVYNVDSGRELPVAGLAGGGPVACLSVNPCGARRVAAGGGAGGGAVRVWELPARRGEPARRN